MAEQLHTDKRNELQKAIPRLTQRLSSLRKQLSKECELHPMSAADVRHFSNRIRYLEQKLSLLTVYQEGLTDPKSLRLPVFPFLVKMSPDEVTLAENYLEALQGLTMSHSQEVSLLLSWAEQALKAPRKTWRAKFQLYRLRRKIQELASESAKLQAYAETQDSHWKQIIEHFLNVSERSDEKTSPMLVYEKILKKSDRIQKLRLQIEQKKHQIGLRTKELETAKAHLEQAPPFAPPIADSFHVLISETDSNGIQNLKHAQESLKHARQYFEQILLEKAK